MSFAFDLFGRPVSASRGKPGRNEHAPDADIAREIRVMLAEGRPMKEIERAVGLSAPTIRKHYFDRATEALREAQARARRDERRKCLLMLSRLVEEGKVAAIRLMLERLDTLDRDALMRELGTADKPAAVERRLSAGKKDAMVEAARRRLEEDPDIAPGLIN